MGIRPNKTDFGLSFGHFGEQNVKERKEENKRRRRGKVWITMDLYGDHVFVWKLGFCMEVFVWRIMVPFLGFR